jgi:transposase
MCDGDFCFVVWDNASQHTTPMLWPFLLENSDRVLTVSLPTYRPHLNLIERLWRYMRDKITRNVFYETFTALCEAWVGWLKRLPFSRFQSLMGIKPRAAPLAA